jgi:hypothetical protein
MVLIVWLLKLPTYYDNRSIEDVEKFLYALLYRGYAEESLIYNGGLLIQTSLDVSLKENEIGLRKHKLYGKDILFVIIDPYIENIDLIYKEVEKNKNRYFILKIRGEALVICFGEDVNGVVNFVKFVWEKIFKEEMEFTLALFGDIELNPQKTV